MKEDYFFMDFDSVQFCYIRAVIIVVVLFLMVVASILLSEIIWGASPSLYWNVDKVYILVLSFTIVLLVTKPYLHIWIYWSILGNPGWRARNSQGTQASGCLLNKYYLLLNSLHASMNADQLSISPALYHSHCPFLWPNPCSRTCLQQALLILWVSWTYLSLWWWIWTPLRIMFLKA